MGKLNQIIAIEKGVKSRAYAGLTELNKAIMKPDLFNGFTKAYQPIDDAGEKLPMDSKRVQLTATDTFRVIEKGMTELMSVTARKDWTNCMAKGDVVVDGKTILLQVPVSYLLFLEKQMNDLRTMAENMPVLDDTDNWTKDTSSGLFKSDPVQTHRTKKTQRPIVLYDATDKHPAQTQLITEDLLAGHWTAVKQSGAMQKPEKLALVERIDKLSRAIKEAREAANNIDEVATPEIGTSVFSFLFPEV